MITQVLPPTVEAILDIARWAPSGDNAQPWTFRIKSDREIDVLIRRTNPNVYEYRQGEPTLISAGALLENIEIAASNFGLRAQWHYVGSTNGIDHIAVSFGDEETNARPALFDEIKQRSVDRRTFKTQPLRDEQKRLLAEALGSELIVQWYNSLSERLEISALGRLATHIRLTIPETFEVHRHIVDWTNPESEHAIPAQALGLDPLTLRLTRWSMAKWSRTKFMNLLGAPYFASLQMDLVPGLFCSSYFVIRLKAGSFGQLDKSTVQMLRAGQAIQRFWLTATKLGLVLQPCVAILAFWSYGTANQEFTTASKARNLAAKLAVDAEAVFGKPDDIVFLGRIGWPRGKPLSRSIRLPLQRLLAISENGKL